MGTILLIEPDKAMQATLVEALGAFGDVVSQPSAASAVAWAHEFGCDAVVMELSLGGHSGFEFLYEFRTYTDWERVPVIVYTNLLLGDEVLRARAWQKLNLASYLYKPHSTLNELRNAVAGVLQT